MSDILKSTGMSMPTVTGDLFITPASTTVIFLSGTIYNSSEASIDLTLVVTKGVDDPVNLVTAIPIASKESYTFPAKLILEPGNILTGFCSAIGGLLSINYVEHGDVYVDAASVHTDAIATQGYAELAEGYVTEAETAATESEASATAAAISAGEASAGVTKTSIEAVLTGELTSHSHALPLHDDLTGSGTNTHAQIDTFLGGTFAPSDAEAHIAPTKVEVETVLTGEISSHTHTVITKAVIETILTGEVTTHTHPDEMRVNTLGSVAVGQTLDCSLYDYFVITPTADLALDITNVLAGTAIAVELIGAGDHGITWAIKSGSGTLAWDEATAPTLATGTGKSVLVFTSNDGSAAYGKTAFVGVV